ncbi:hypothetical protein K1T71_002947 [Dendrolimus kikuchii]|uniref:Uncharacterized protein n=1 Tax=Dendrolimus kikuchii TaxID=765133 RepID=A0ACC1DBS3_9NEOP|nr:hypothetical protein K1T71_002947 [Dendrolimus kikuchii]
MKSKSFELKQIAPERAKHNKTFAFVGFYKSVAETNKQLTENAKAIENGNLETPKSKKEGGRHERSSNKAKRKHKNEVGDIPQTSRSGPNINSTFGGSTPINEPKVTSTPNNAKSSSDDSRVKSIMKTKPPEDHSMDGSITNTSIKPKKRNKCVSFMLEDTEAVVTKKTKSDDSINNKSETNEKGKLNKKHFKKLVLDKENKAKPNQNVDVNQESECKTREHKAKSKISKNEDGESVAEEKENKSQGTKRKFKKFKRNKSSEQSEQSEQSETDTNATEGQDTKTKKLKKKKRQVKQQIPETKSEGEPASKFPKKDIAEDLENLNIGDNAHTLTNLLDEMTVVDKDKKKKLKQKFNKEKRKNPQTDKKLEQDSEEVKEKVKWNKRKWNKDKKGDINEQLATMIIIENLPISIMLTFKKLLTDHFGKYGLIKNIGIAEMYPTEESRPVFTTTINFYSDGAATDALEEDGTMFEGSRIRIKRPLPPTDTTLVIRSYGELNEQSVASLFTGAGKIRSIRHLVKGKKSMSTVFVEFDGPESVERAIQMAAKVKVGGKKVHIAKFEVRKKKEKPKSETESGADTEDSND